VTRPGPSWLSELRWGASNGEDCRHGNHEAAQDEIRGWAVAGDHVPDAHQGMAALCDDAHANDDPREREAPAAR
jgi:hypothetical protein